VLSDRGKKKKPGGREIDRGKPGQVFFPAAAHLESERIRGLWSVNTIRGHPDNEASRGPLVGGRDSLEYRGKE